MQQILVQYYPTRLGELMFGSFNDQLCICDWHHRKSRSSIDQRICQGLNASMKEGVSEVIDNAIVEISNYLDGKKTEFNTPLLSVGTAFQQKVWESLKSIPYGETLSYSKLSTLLGQPKAIRAVASAVGANALSIFIPCHRVVGEDGSLTGYAGGLPAKRALLKLEYDVIGHQYQLFQ